jgi:hypothetical protein
VCSATGRNPWAAILHRAGAAARAEIGGRSRSAGARGRRSRPVLPIVPLRCRRGVDRQSTKSGLTATWLGLAALCSAPRRVPWTGGQRWPPNGAAGAVNGRSRGLPDNGRARRDGGAAQMAGFVDCQTTAGPGEMAARQGRWAPRAPAGRRTPTVGGVHPTYDARRRSRDILRCMGTPAPVRARTASSTVTRR